MYEDGVNFYMFTMGVVKLLIGMLIFMALAYLLNIEKVWVKKEMKVQAYESALIDLSAKKHGLDLNVELAKLTAYDTKTFRDIVKEKVLSEVQKK